MREQVAAYERGETLEQSTYDYDPDTDRLTVHRSKEEADDYRYFPEPDLVPVEPPAELVERLRGELGELPGCAHPPARAGRSASTSPTSSSTTGNEPKAAALVARRRRAGASAANIAMNQPRLPAGERGRAREDPRRRTSTREALNAAFAAARDRLDSTRTTYLGADRGQRRVGARARDRRGARREPAAGRDVPRRQGGRARLPRRPGDEGDAAARPTRRSSTGFCGRSCRRSAVLEPRRRGSRS